jgi:serine/threonine-protein kinase
MVSETWGALEPNSPGVSDRFRLINKIGEGGMGEVWVAEDLRLNRRVALKFLARLSTNDLERFMREGKLAAKLNHPHIVRVHDMGVLNGRYYICMDYINGTPLEGRSLGTRRALEVISEIAGAVQYAHEHGVVHRDIKPENILMDEHGRVYLTDFGLAKGVESSNLSTSRTGAVLGTPAYMSPEAARGTMKEVGPLSDVYSLGATLYDLLSGQEPFHDETFIQMLSKITSVDPTPLRKVNPKIAEDIETIVSKAMSKEPERRYASAGDLAADIKRFLAGEPIVARPPSIVYRLTRRVRKNPLAYALAVAAAVAGVVALGVWHSAVQETERLKDQQRLADDRFKLERDSALEMLRETARTSLDIALDLRRVGQNTAMPRALPLMENAYKRAASRTGDLAEVDYLMGRLHRALLQDDKAMELQNAALAKDPDFGPALYERSVLLTKQYGKLFWEAHALANSMEIGPATSKDAMRHSQNKLHDLESIRPEMVVVKQKLIKDLEHLSRTLNQQKSRWISGANYLAAKALLQFIEQKWELARSNLLEAVKQDPLMEEAWEALGQIAMYRVNFTQDRVEREKLLNEAIQAHSDGLQRDQGYVPHLLRRGYALLTLGRDCTLRGLDPHKPFDDAEADFIRAVALDPRNVEAVMHRGLTRATRAFYLASRLSLDCIPMYEQAEQDLTQAIELDPRSPMAWMHRCSVRSNIATYRSTKGGGDPIAVLDEAEKDGLQATNLSPELAEGWVKRGIVYANRGLFKQHRLKDPLPDFEQAEKCYTEALRLNKTLLEGWMWRAGLRTNWGVFLRQKGKDPLSMYRKAEQDHSFALELDPKNPEVYMRRGTLRGNIALYCTWTGRDPMPPARLAEEDFEHAHENAPNNPDIFYRQGYLRNNLAYWRFNSGQNPIEHLDAADQAYARAVELHKDYAEAWKARGDGANVRAGYYERAGDPRAADAYADAVKFWKEAIRCNSAFEAPLRSAIKKAEQNAAKKIDY